MNQKAIQQLKVLKAAESALTESEESLVVESPLQVELHFDSPNGLIKRDAGNIMRTPGHDEELALGFLFSEGIIEAGSEVAHSKQSNTDSDKVIIKLPGNSRGWQQSAKRQTTISSACGMCGRPMVDDLIRALPFPVRRNPLPLSSEIIFGLQEKMRAGQSVFESTGGIHAAGLFNAAGELLLLREDIGRHNAVDKIVGYALKHDILPLRDNILLLSGRAGFELLQKAAMAGIPVVASVGAPSSLAVETAKEVGITLIGFLRDRRFNIYSQFDNMEGHEISGISMAQHSCRE